MTFYVVATPIGNLSDMTFRAVEVLKKVDFILAEDTRVTRKLLNHFEIETKLISFHEYSDEKKYEKIFELLRNGSELALVCDAGTPAISDPGYFLIQKIKENLPETKIVPIPGASAITTLISTSGVNAKEFTFLGFPPHKKGRKTFFEKLIQESENRPVIIYESKHRIIKALESVKSVIDQMGENQMPTDQSDMNQKLSSEKTITIGRELTKTFEEIVQGSAEEILDYFVNNSEKIKGEFVIIIS